MHCDGGSIGLRGVFGVCIAWMNGCGMYRRVYVH